MAPLHFTRLKIRDVREIRLYIPALYKGDCAPFENRILFKQIPPE